MDGGPGQARQSRRLPQRCQRSSSRAAREVGWDRGEIVEEIEEVFRGDHYARLNWRDTTEKIEPPEGVGSDAVGLMGWLLADDVEEAYAERLHPRDRLGGALG